MTLRRRIGTAVLAGFAGAVFAAIAADLFGLSVPIAAVAAGIALALIVDRLIARDPPPD